MTATVRWGIAIALVFALTLRVVFLQTRISQLEAAGTNRMVRAEARSNFEIDFPGVEDGQTTKQMQSNTHICDQDSTKSTEAEWKSPVVVAICLSNASPDNIEEIEVALKSVRCVCDCRTGEDGVQVQTNGCFPHSSLYRGVLATSAAMDIAQRGEACSLCRSRCVVS